MSAELSCSHHPENTSAKLIVLTGGPGAGKTAILEFMKRTLCPHVAILPEAASILFSGGFWRLQSESARKASQRAIYHVQSELQRLVIEEKKWVLGLCDRGTLDGLAYWPDGVDDFYADLQTTKAKEYAKYAAVIHLRTPNQRQGYNHQNPIRTEGPELAAAIDKRIAEVWSDHPGYSTIDSADYFIEKMNKASEKIHEFIPKN